MSITFSLRTTDGNLVCTANHGADCDVAEHLLDESTHPYPGYCVPCAMDRRDECPVCSLDLNVSDNNAMMLLERLGIEFDSCGTIDPIDLLGRALVANVGRDDSGTPMSGERWVDAGLRPGYYDDRMTALVTLALTAKERGLVIDWC